MRPDVRSVFTYTDPSDIRKYGAMSVVYLYYQFQVVDYALRKTTVYFHSHLQKFLFPRAFDSQLLSLYACKYAQTSENELSSARTGSVKNIKCSQKIHRHLEMPNIDSITSCHLRDYDILAGQLICGAVKTGCFRSKTEIVTQDGHILSVRGT